MGDTPQQGKWGCGPTGRPHLAHVVESRHRLRVERVARSSAEVNEYKQQTMAEERGDASSRSSEDRPRPQGSSTNHRGAVGGEYQPLGQGADGPVGRSAVGINGRKASGRGWMQGWHPLRQDQG